MSIEGVVFLVLLIDAIGANLVAHFASDWYAKRFGVMSRWFPPAKGWAAYYLVLVMWFGSILYRADMLL